MEGGGDQSDGPVERFCPKANGFSHGISMFWCSLLMGFCFWFSLSLCLKSQKRYLPEPMKKPHLKKQ